MNIQQLAQQRLFLNTDPLAAFREDVAVQAMRHTQRRVKGKAVDIISKARPNEGKEIKQYRADNERQITREGVEKFISKVTRIITKGLRFTNVEGKLKEYVDTRPFYDTGNRYTFEDYVHGVLFPLAIENPNLLCIAFPYNPIRPDIAPNAAIKDGGLKESEKLGIDIKLVSPTYVDNECFVYSAGERQVGKDKHPFFYAADKDNWYTLEPSYVRGERGGKQLIYTPVVWYAWDLGTSPVNLLPGTVATTMYGKYRESFLMPYFQLADEVINAFSDNQAIRVRFAHPLMGIQEVPCYNEGCNKGKVKNGNEFSTCGTCHGKGTVTSPGPFGTIVKARAGLTQQGTDGPAVEYYNPDMGILSESWNTWKELLIMAKQSVGLDLLEGSGSESGRAKALRMEDLLDLLTQVGISMGTCGAQLLQQLEALLVPVIADRKDPSYTIPASLKIYETAELKDNAEGALFEDRYKARIDYYRHKYRGEPNEVRLYEIALSYSPAMLLNEDELRIRLASGTLTSDDIAKRDYAIIALRDLSEERKIDLGDIAKVAAFAAIDAYLLSRNLIAPVGNKDIEEERTKSPLLETVGGVTGIVAISQAVADGAMTEIAAENLLVEVFGFSREKAGTLIDPPRNAEETPQGESQDTRQGNG